MIYCIKDNTGRYFEKEKSFDNLIFMTHYLSKAHIFSSLFFAKRKLNSLKAKYEDADVLYIEEVKREKDG